MPFNGSGVFQRVRNWVADATAGIKIRADFHDSEDDGFATGLSNCITRDGQTVVTQNIPFNSKRITGLADPVNPQDAATMNYAVAKTGDSMTGTLVLNDTGSGGATIEGMKYGKLRWVMHLGNNEPENLNSGSEFDLIRYADDGTTLGSVMRFDRVNGTGVFPGTINSQGVIVEDLIITKTVTAILGSSNIGQSAMGPFQISGDGTGHPMITFHHSGSSQVNFGMGLDGNFYIGGGMLGVGTAFRVWTQRDGPLLTTADLDALRARIEALEGKKS